MSRFTGRFGLITGNHITSKGEREWMFRRIKENKNYILPPWEFAASMGVLFITIKFLQIRDFIVGFVLLEATACCLAF